MNTTKNTNDFKMSAQGAQAIPNSNVGRPTSLLMCVCRSCGAIEKIEDVGINMILYRSNCLKCLSYERQSFSEWNPLNDNSVLDIRGNLYKGANWLFDDRHHGKSMLSHYIKVPAHLDDYVNLAEDLAFLAHSLIISTCLFERYIAIAKFCKMRGNRLSIVQIMMYLAGDLAASAVEQTKVDKKLVKETVERLEAREKPTGWEPQAYEMKTDNIFAEMRTYLGCYEKLKECAMYKKLHKVLLYMLSVNMLNGVNITFDSLEFDKYQEKIIKQTHKPGVDMAHCFLDTICFVADRGIQYFKTGDATTILHSGNTYEKWLTTANRLKREARFMTNPEPHGVNKFTFLSELKDTIEKGRSIIKFTPGLEKWERMSIQSTQADLEMIEANEITRKNAQEPRKDPFAILLHGASNICKSQLKQIMFYHYASYFGLPSSANYMYTRCPTDEYWSGFDSTQWCIVMDDIAFLKPNNEVDPTLKELLQVKNSVPYTPPQAALEDKGRTPVRAELLIGTTNTKHLNLHAYFACPFAIARRLPYVITARVKPDYVKNGFMADSNLIPVTPEGEYMDIWYFEVSEPAPVAGGDIDAQQTKYVPIKDVPGGKFYNIHDMLAWYITVAEKHNVAQIKATQAENSMRSASVCRSCKRVTAHCTCHVVQADIILNTFVQNVSSLEVPETPKDLLENFPLYVKFILCAVEWISTAGINPVPFRVQDLSPLSKILILIYLASVACKSQLYFWFVVSICPIYYYYVYFFYILRFVCEYMFGFNWKYKMIYKLIGNKEICMRLLYRIAGERVRNLHFTNKSLKTLVIWISSSAVIFAITKMINYKFASTKQSEGRVPVPHDVEKPTFYYTDPYKLNPLDISEQSKCLKGNHLENLLIRSTARFIMKFDSRGNKMFSTTALNVQGDVWILNRHAFEHGRDGVMDIIFDDITLNVSRNVSNYRFEASDFVEINTKGDVLIMRISCLPPGKNLVPYFAKDNLINGNYAGKYYMIGRNGQRSIKEVANIFAGKCPIWGEAGYHGKVQILTEKGDCGSPCLGAIGSGGVILGIHSSGNPYGSVFMQHISQNMLLCALEKFEQQVEMGCVPISAIGCTRIVGPLHEKSTLRFVPKGTVTVYGSFVGYRPQHKSRVVASILAPALEKYGYEQKYGKPDMTWKPWNIAANDLTKPYLNVKKSTIQMCADAFLEDIKVGLGDKVKEICKYTTDVALNGVDGIAYVDKMNVNTSAGNPFKKCKREFMTFDELNKIIDLDPVIVDRMNKIRDCYRRGMRFHPQFCGHLKDDPLPNEKILLGKTRVFTGSELAWSIIVREYYLSIIRLIQNNPILFEAMPGVVAQSTDWQAMYTHLVNFGLHQMIGGDYKSFDKSMTSIFIMSAFGVMIDLAKEAGMDDEDLLAMRCIAYDTAFACIDLNGDLIEVQTNPSGHPLTVIINCFVNSIYMRYAFYITTGKHPREFKQYVHLVTYGDDNLMNVSPEIPLFNHTRIVVALKMIGVTYTMADKESASVPYIHMNECSFLKRKFVYDADIGAIVAPLDNSSFEKMLTCYVNNGTLAPEAHAMCVIETAIREYFFHGKEIFLQKSNMFREVINELNLGLWVRDSTFPSYEELVNEFWKKDTHGIKPNELILR